MEDNRKKLAKLSREEYRSIVSERLKALAELHNLDTKGFAEKCGISTRRMRNLMNGTANLRIPEMLDISDAFNVSIELSWDVIHIRCRHRRMIPNLPCTH